MNTKEMFGNLLDVTGELYGKHVSPILVDLYWRILKRYEWDDVRRAFETFVENPDNGQFMPKPADIVRLIKGDSKSQGLKAWSKVEQAISHVGPYRSVVFDDCLIHAALQEMGGWIRICSISEKELPFVAKEFQTRYMGLCQKPPQDFPKYFMGINNHQNAQYSLALEEPVFIGERQKAQASLSQENQEIPVLSCSKTENQLIREKMN